MIGKKAQSGDYLAFIIFVIGLIGIYILSNFIITPSTGGKKEGEIKVEMEYLSYNPFLYGFLRQNIENKNMADLIAFSYMNKDYSNLKRETINILENVGKKANFRIYINKKEVIEQCETKCKGKTKEFNALLPLPNKEVIKFELLLYETE